jgi:hypothetical protein
VNGVIGDFVQFLNKLDCIINYLYKPVVKFIICGGTNFSSSQGQLQETQKSECTEQ